jgi:sensor histidine kinase regulating citrate/malate metabolism
MTSTDEGGAYFGTEIPQSEQVQLMANVGVALLVAHRVKAGYYGADTRHIAQIANESEAFFHRLTAVLTSEETRE